MSSKEFLFTKLKEIHSQIKKISIKYSFDEYKIIHIIEILPLDTYKDNEEYINWEMDVYQEFMHLHPNETLLFISENSLSKLSNAEFELTPQLVVKVKDIYIPNKTIYTDISISNINMGDLEKSNNTIKESIKKTNAA